LPESDSLVIFESKMKEPCSVIIEAKVNGIKQSIGLIVDPYKIKPGSALPKDFKVYWDQKKQILKSLRMEVKTKKMEISDSGYVCFNTEINCTGPKTAIGYFAKPTKVRSLPIVLVVHAGGVKGFCCRSETANALNYTKKGRSLSTLMRMEC
jgi:cephalosporin-C deacetylase-like acetyl esterase